MDRYIITGGPGSGKTTLLEALAGLKYTCSPEVSRQIIMEEAGKESGCLPWLNMSCFADKVLDKMILAYQDCANTQLTFYDRGIPDIIAYLEVAGLPVGEQYIEALQLHPYHKTAFVLPPWPQIYVNDSERWQLYQQAEELYEGIIKTYKTLGFDLIEVPMLAVDARAEFVLNNIEN